MTGNETAALIDRTEGNTRGVIWAVRILTDIHVALDAAERYADEFGLPHP